MKNHTLYIYNKTKDVLPILICLLVAMAVSGNIFAYQREMSPLGQSMAEEDSVITDSLAEVVTDTLAEYATDSLVNDSLPWPQSLQQNIATIIEKSSFLTKSQVGLMVYDLTDDSVLYSHNHRQTLRPASTMKLITAITALDKLGGSYQFKTSLRYTGTVIDSLRTLKGDVFLVGGMDPRFNRDDLLAFVESLKSLGIDTIRGNIYVDRSMKDRDRLGEGWCWDDDNPVLTPTLYSRKDLLMEQFVMELGNAGIVFDGNMSDRTAPSSAKVVCVRTHSIDQILTKMMKDSDNLYAECMLYQTALTHGRPAKASGARAITQRLIRKMKLAPGDYKIADGSGLSLYNYVTAELEVPFLKYAYENSTIYNHLFTSLPVAGVDGTLAKRMKATKAADNVRAKTGTLTGISSLAGYAKAANGHLLAFCIINQGVLRAAPAKAFQDKVCIALCR